MFVDDLVLIPKVLYYVLTLVNNFYLKVSDNCRLNIFRNHFFFPVTSLWKIIVLFLIFIAVRLV